MTLVEAALQLVQLNPETGAISATAPRLLLVAPQVRVRAACPLPAPLA